MYTPADNYPSTARLRAIARKITTPFVLLNLTHRHISITPAACMRLASVARDTGAAMIYTDYSKGARDGSGEICRTVQRLPGSFSEMTDFGHAVLIDTNRMRIALSKAGKGWRYAGFYDLWLRLTRAEGSLFHLPECVYTSLPGEDITEQMCDCAEAEVEYASVFADHLKAVGVWLGDRTEEPEVSSDAKASVIVTVTGPCDGLAATIRSALTQQGGHIGNVIAVDASRDNQTAVLLREMSIEDPRLIVLTPRRRISAGGCWNAALSHRLCGAWAVRLDAGDLFSDGNAVERIIAAMSEERAALAVDGSYVPDRADQILRSESLGQVRAVVSDTAKMYPAPDIERGWDYGVALGLTRRHKVVASGIGLAWRAAGHNEADSLRTIELRARLRLIHSRR